MRKQDNMPARNKKNFRSTKSGAGMTAKGVAAYRRANPGSKLKTAVTGKVKKGSKDANRRKSYCARSAGQLKKLISQNKLNDPNSRIRQARKKMEMLDKWLIHKFCNTIDNITDYIDSWCDARYKTIRNFFNKKRKRRKTKKSV